jgi:hypothetical protein
MFEENGEPFWKRNMNICNGSQIELLQQQARQQEKESGAKQPTNRSEYMEAMKTYFEDLFTSDVTKLSNLDEQLKIWMIQLLENSVDSGATRVECRFIRMGAEGFDVIDNGQGIKEEDFADYVKTEPFRERNDIYKTRSLGFRGEALYSLVKSSHITIMTKVADDENGYELTYDTEGELVSKTAIRKFRAGTTIEIRNIHQANARMAIAYKKHNRE